MPQQDLLVNGMTISELLAFHRSVFGDARMDDPPERPSDVTQEEWDALGDPGRRAIARVRQARDAAVAAQTAATQERDAAQTLAQQRQVELEQARQAAAGGAPADVNAQIQAAVAAAVQQVTETFNGQIQQLNAAQAAERLLTRAQQIAADVLVVPDLVGSLVDLSTMTDGQGALNEQALRDNLATLVDTRPELRRPPTVQQNPFGGHPGGARPPAEKAAFDARVAEQLAIARRSGLAVRSDPPPSTS